MIKKIIRMVSQFGDTKLDSLMSWFPQNETSEVIDKINSANDLILIGDVVSIKKQANIDEMNLTKEEIFQLINKYNSKVEDEFDNLSSNIEKMKLDTVINFLNKKYTLEKYENNDGLEVFVQLEKDTSINKGYVIIVSKLSNEIYEKIDKLFNNETVFVYYINSNEYGECRTTKEFYIKSCKAILDEYMVEYKLESEIIKINTIEVLTGGEINE